MVSNINANFDFYLKSDLSKFKKANWIAIYNNKVITQGKELSLVTKNAKKTAPLEKILFSKI
jgi:hypothetical protein